MFERFTHSARTAVVLAQEEARRHGHREIGTAHLLLALLKAEADGASDTLRAHGVTPEAVEQELTTLMNRRPRADLDDAEVLAALGIDIARIREAVEANFGPGALDRAGEESPRRRGLLAHLRSLLGRLLGRTDPFQSGRSGHIPFSPAAKKTLELSLREAIRLNERTIEGDHLLLGLLRSADGGAAAILSKLGVDVGDLRAEIERRRRRSA